MKNKAILSVLTALLLLVTVSCHAPRKITVYTHDTISHQVLITKHDTAIITKPDSAGWTAYFTCIKNSQGNYIPTINSQSTTSGTNLHVFTRQNTANAGLNVNVECKSDSLKRVITLLNKTITDFKSRSEVDKIPVNYQTGWQKFVGYLGYIFMGCILIILIFLISKLAKIIKI